MIIWFASGNVHKKAELSAILNSENKAEVPCSGAVSIREIKIPVDAGLSFDPEETGNSFHENALIKARELYRLLAERRPALYSPGAPVIADDSGLCVDALGGRPGINSARYTGRSTGRSREALNGKKLESPERNALLLEELEDKPRRGARFVCAIVLLFSPERFYLAQETLEGEIVKGPAYARGTGGFGYDPIFFIPELGRTMAELSEAEKNRVSHRGKAGKAVADMLRALE
ncbi:MAG: non-canonical purine NTP pyrophosphatase [Treponema sp.]|jgi:XTP/dITP diphosphohydrolase|nr:non-canonical purine NTP pyrophosphatase [Treponema sp.]